MHSDLDADKKELWIFGYGSLIWKPPEHWIHAYPGFVRGFVRRFWQASNDHRGTPKNPGRVLTLLKKEDWKHFKFFEPTEVLENEDLDIVWGVMFCISPKYAEKVRDQLRIREIHGYRIQYVDVYCPKRICNTWYEQFLKYMKQVDKSSTEEAARLTAKVNLTRYLDNQELIETLLSPIKSKQTYEQVAQSHYFFKKKAIIYIGSPENEAFVGPHRSMDSLARHICKCEGLSGKNVEYLFNIAHSLRFIHPGGSGEEHIFHLESLAKEIMTNSPNDTEKKDSDDVQKSHFKRECEV